MSRGKDPFERLVSAVEQAAGDDVRATTFVRGLVLGAVVGAAIAGSTLWQRRHPRPTRAIKAHDDEAGDGAAADIVPGELTTADSSLGPPQGKVGSLVCRGMRSAAGRLESLAYWVASDHFVELGEPGRLFHGGFGLLTIGNLRKPRFWAIRILELLGERELRTTMEGDGDGGLVEAWATKDPDGRIAIALWNGTIDQSKGDGDALLDRSVRLVNYCSGLCMPEIAAMGAFERLDMMLNDALYGILFRDINPVRTLVDQGFSPDANSWSRLRAADRLDELEPEGQASVGREGSLSLDFDLPMPSVSLVELLAEPSGANAPA